MPDRRTPFTIADEKQTLLDFLDYLRESVILKVEGIDEELARTPGVPSGTSLMGLVKHLARVEMAWFQIGFAGRDIPVPDDELADTDTKEGLIAAYRSAIAASNEIIAGCSDLTTRCVWKMTAPEPMSMRWVLIHMVEETGRHAGHADILREQIDGAVGR
jgi:uncharacterized damage-inducible protein DinB